MCVGNPVFAMMMQGEFLVMYHPQIARRPTLAAATAPVEVKYEGAM